MKTCSVEGCESPYIEARGMCARHYDAWRRNGHTNIQERARYDPVCSVEGCTKPHLSKGLCGMHLHRWKTHGTTDDPRPAVAAKKVEQDRPTYVFEPYNDDPAENVRSQSLWVSVILQAIEDAVHDPDDVGHGADASWSRSLRQRVEHEREHARAWLTRPSAEFNHVCNLAGLDPAYVRENARRYIRFRDKLRRMIEGVRTGGWSETFNDTPGTGGGRRETHFEGVSS